MATIPPSRPGEPPAEADGSAALREASPVRTGAVAAIVAAAFLVVVVLVGGGVDRRAPAFLLDALGSEEPDASLERRPAPGVDVSIDEAGYTVARGGSSLSVEAEGIDGEEWERYAHGASRKTRFGAETILIDGSTTESFLTVSEHQGAKRWRWRLETRLVPRLRRDGGVSFRDPTRHRDSDIAIHPVTILDGEGRDVTPDGLRWRLVHERGDWWLTLDLDDAGLPLPYVIDPAADYASPLYLSSQASAATGSWRLVTAAPGTLDTTTRTEPCRNCTGYYQWAPGTATVTAGTPSATPTGAGWVVDTAGATGFPAGDWAFTVQTDVPNTTLVAGSAYLTVAVWKGTIAGGAFTATQNLLFPADGTTNLRTTTSPLTTTETFALPRFSLAADERLYVEFWRRQAGGIDAPQAARRQLDFYVDDGVAAVAHPPADDVPPAHALSVAELTNAAGQHFDAPSGTHYYSTAADGSFRIDDDATDAGSGVARVDFPAVSLPGFTHAAASDPSSPYQSNTYAWTTASAASPGDQAIVAEDEALNQSSPSPELTIVRDADGPDAFALSSPDAAEIVEEGDPVAAVPSDAGAGVASVEFRYCPGASCTFGAGTTVDAPDATAPYSAVWSGQPADGVYTLVARARDNVGNTTDSGERTITVDNGGPSAVFSFPAAGASYGAAGWDAGCAAAGFCGTASDSGSGVDQVEISLERAGSGLYWDGGAFTAAVETFLPASLAGADWTYGFPASSFPADGDYTAHVRATDAAGHVEPGPSRTFTIDTTAPETTVGTGPADPSDTGEATFTFGADEAGATFECELDGDGFSPCASPQSYSGLGGGSHTFRVRATDAAGNTDLSPGAFAWTIDGTPPETTIDSGPADPAATDAAAFTFDADEAGATFECELDGGGFSPCASPQAYTGLAEGAHTFRVRAHDAVGNTDATPAEHAWTVDTVDPTGSVTAPGEGAFIRGTVTVSSDSADTGSGVESVLFERRASGGGAWTSLATDTTAPYSVEWDTTALADAAYELRVTATDAAGNVFASPVRTVSVDNDAPTVALTTPAAFVNASAPDPFTVTAASPDGDLTEIELFRCSNATAACASGSWVSLGSDGTAPYTASWPVDGDGNRALRAVAADAAGNEGEDVVDVTIDRTPPGGTLTAPAAGAFLAGTVSVGADSSDAGSGVASAAFEARSSGGAWSAVGDDSTAPYEVDWDASGLSGDFDLRVVTTDAAGNATVSAARTVTVDNDPPAAPTLTLAEASPYAHVSGAEIFVNTGEAGSYDVAAEASDTGSGIERVSFPGGLDDTTPPYEAGYAFGDLAGAQTVTAVDRAGNGAGSAFTVTPDTTAPDAFALTAPAPGNTIVDGQAVSASPADAAAGVAGVEFRYCAGATCSFADATPLGSDATAPYSVTWSSQPPDGTYTLLARATDYVGNAAVSTERVVTVDNSGPSASLGVAEGARPDLQWLDSVGETLFYNPAATGDFRLTAAAGDPAGVQSVEFPAIAETGFSGPAATDTASPYESDVYSFTSANAAAPADAIVIARDSVGNATAVALSFVRDAAAPSGGSVSYAGGYDADGQVSVTVHGGSDALSGLAPGSALLERRTAVLSGPSCDAFAGAWTPAASPDTVASGTCAEYRYRISDRVGNEAVYTSAAVVKVDLDAPETALDAAPGDPSADADAALAFSATEPGATFECELDGGGFSPCTSPQAHTGLPDGTHSFRVRATDAAGNTDATPAVHTWTIDTGAPDTTIDSAPADPSLDDSPAFAFSANEPGVDFDCELDGGGFSPCTSPHPVGLVADGAHTFRVRATDAAGNPDATPAAHAWTVDTAAPDTFFTAVPANPSNDPEPTFEFGASEAGSTLECELDGGGFVPCASPQPLGPLADGTHTVSVRAEDAAGNEDASPASYTWLVDAVAPAISLTEPAQVVNAADADPLTIRATSPDADVASVEFFRCSDASAACATGSWASLGSDASPPFEASWPVDPDGNRALRAVAADAGGNEGETVVDVAIDRTRPVTTVVSAPPDPTASDSATFAFGAGEAATFECELDGGGFSACTSPQAYAGLADGAHTFAVRATDAAGNGEAAPPTVSWTVDTAAPETTIDAAPGDPSGDAAPAFEFSASEAGASFECALDGGGFSSCTSPRAYAGLADGAHTFAVRASDAAGNADATPAAHAWTVDATPPGGGLADPGDHLRGTVTLSASPSDVGAGIRDVEFQLSPAGAGAWSPIALDPAEPYAAAWDTTAVGDGLYDLRVVATDNAGNASPSAEVAGRRVDNTPPSVTMNDPGADLRATVALTAAAGDAGSGVASLSFERSPAGADAWTATPASWDTTVVGDGLYDLRAVVTDAAGNSSVSAPVTGRRVDNALPGLTGSAPADGATVLSAGSLQLTADEDVTGIANATLDGAPAAAPTVSGATLTWFGPFADGAHTLAGELEDLAGNRRPIRVHFTVWSLPTDDYPYVEKNVLPGETTSLTAASGAAVVTVPAGAWTGAPAGDWLVLRLDPRPAAAVPSGFRAAGDVLDVTAYWALAGGSVGDFAPPLEIALEGPSARTVAATFEAGAWRVLRRVPGKGLPAGWADGFDRDGSDVVVLSRHLSLFTLLEDVQRPTAPAGFRGTVKGGRFSLAWKPSRDEGGVAGYTVYANGAVARTLGPAARSAAMGAFRLSDTRSFQVAAADVAGNAGARSPTLRVVPRVVGLRLAAAKRALVARGFRVGKVTYRRSTDVRPGVVVRGSAFGLRRVGASVALAVSSGGGAARPDAAPPAPPPAATFGGTISPSAAPPPAAFAPPTAPLTPPTTVTPAATDEAALDRSPAPAPAPGPQVRPLPLAEQTSAGVRRPLGYLLLVLAFGGALLAGIRLVEPPRSARAIPGGVEPLVLWDARVLDIVVRAARRLARA